MSQIGGLSSLKPAPKSGSDVVNQLVANDKDGASPPPAAGAKEQQLLQSASQQARPKLLARKVQIIDSSRLLEVKNDQAASDSKKLGKIGAGGFCEVYEMRLLPAADDRNGVETPVAAKIIKTAEELTREVEMIHAIPKHDNVISLIGVVMDAEQSLYYAVMPLATGDLSGVINADFEKAKGENRKYLSKPEEVKQFIRRALQICQAVEHLHTKAIVDALSSAEYVEESYPNVADQQASKTTRKYLLHADIKPSNVLVFYKIIQGCTVEILQLADFGLAKISTDTASSVQSRIQGGSAPYMPPEQWSTHEKMGRFTDVYSVGATMWQMVTGQLPKQVKMSANDSRLRALDHAGFENPQCPSEIADLIAKCTQLDPKARPTIRQVIEELQQILRRDRDTAYRSVNDVVSTTTTFIGAQKVERPPESNPMVTLLRQFDDNDDKPIADFAPTQEELKGFFDRAGATLHEVDIILQAVELSRRIQRAKEYTRANLSITSVVTRLMGLDKEYSSAFVTRLALYQCGWIIEGEVLTHNASVADATLIEPAVTCITQALLLLGFKTHLLTAASDARVERIKEKLPDEVLKNFQYGPACKCDVDLEVDFGACLVVESPALLATLTNDGDLKGYVGVFVVTDAEAAKKKVTFRNIEIPVGTRIEPIEKPKNLVAA